MAMFERRVIGADRRSFLSREDTALYRPNQNPASLFNVDKKGEMHL